MHLLIEKDNAININIEEPSLNTIKSKKKKKKLTVVVTSNNLSTQGLINLVRGIDMLYEIAS